MEEMTTFKIIYRTDGWKSLIIVNTYKSTAEYINEIVKREKWYMHPRNFLDPIIYPNNKELFKELSIDLKLFDSIKEVTISLSIEDIKVFETTEIVKHNGLKTKLINLFMERGDAPIIGLVNNLANPKPIENYARLLEGWISGEEDTYLIRDHNYVHRRIDEFCKKELGFFKRVFGGFSAGQEAWFRAYRMTNKLAALRTTDHKVYKEYITYLAHKDIGEGKDSYSKIWWLFTSYEHMPEEKFVELIIQDSRSIEREIGRKVIEERRKMLLE